MSHVPAGSPGAESSPKSKDWWDKLDIIAKLLSGALLAVLAFAVNYGAEKISTSLKTGDLVRNMISDLSSKNEGDVRQDMALITLDHSVGYGAEDNALVSEIAEKILDNPRSDNPATTVAFKILKKRNPQKADEYQKRWDEIISGSRSSLRSSPADEPLAATPSPTAQASPEPSATPSPSYPTPQASPTTRPTTRPTPVPAPTQQDQVSVDRQFVARLAAKLVFVQFKNDKALAQELAQKLKEQGFNAPGVEAVPGKYSYSVRYFHAEDAELAAQVAAIVSNFLKSKNIAGVAVAPVRFQGKSPLGQVEVWLDR